MVQQQHIAYAQRMEYVGRMNRIQTWRGCEKGALNPLNPKPAGVTKAPTTLLVQCSTKRDPSLVMVCLPSLQLP
jgi:hypothetical protein